MKYVFALMFLFQFLLNSESAKKLARDNPRAFFKRFNVNFIDKPGYFLLDLFNRDNSPLNLIGACEFANNGKQIVFIKGGMMPTLTDNDKFDVYYLPDVAHLIVAIQSGFKDQYLKMRVWRRKRGRT